MDHLAKARGRNGSAGRKQQGERAFIWNAALQGHSGIEGQALVVLAMKRVGFNELVVEKDCWLGNKVEQVVGIWDIRDFEELENEGVGVVNAISKCVSVNLLKLVHNKYSLCTSYHRGLLSNSLWS
ncbi:hypothetical protein PanWU01x14_040800 [Parasponia andersonii]|uniref:Uncharacterized protein n=1 Tax=Parasponia andersonii TaxID=3476 RepID=A0A2P5DQ83_PARAD|nr:hypothetical protein PanWU01x14_040800 [Parasponia andersonii]